MGLFEALRDGNREVPQAIWSTKFSRALERYLALLSDLQPEGAAKSRPWPRRASMTRRWSSSSGRPDTPAVPIGVPPRRISGTPPPLAAKSAGAGDTPVDSARSAHLS